jgi:hypothetical protein
MERHLWTGFIKMDDLIKALRDGAGLYEEIRSAELVMDDAADEIERLRDLLAYNFIDPDAMVDSAKDARRRTEQHGKTNE